MAQKASPKKVARKIPSKKKPAPAETRPAARKVDAPKSKPAAKKSRPEIKPSVGFREKIVHGHCRGQIAPHDRRRRQRTQTRESSELVEV